MTKELRDIEFIRYLLDVVEHQDKLIEEKDEEIQRLITIKTAYEERQQNNFINNK